MVRHAQGGASACAGTRLDNPCGRAGSGTERRDYVRFLVVDGPGYAASDDTPLVSVPLQDPPDAPGSVRAFVESQCKGWFCALLMVAG